MFFGQCSLKNMIAVFGKTASIWLWWWVLLMLALCLSDAHCKRMFLARFRSEPIDHHHFQPVKHGDSSDDAISNPIKSTDAENPNENSIYSEWSKWSRCRKRCKQVRTRICIAPSVCQSNVLKEERSCSGDRCRPKSIPSMDNNNHLIGGRGRSTEFKVLYHLQSYVYSQWSKWSPCTENCQTRRYRTCEMKEICGNSTIHEDAICAKKGSNCEKYFKSKSQVVDSFETMDHHHQHHHQPHHHHHHHHDSQQSGNDSRLINDDQCGQSLAQNDLASVLRIIGGREASKGKWPWVVAILNRNQDAFCGGTLITSQFVITAAHCVRRRLFVRAGEHDLVIPEGSEQQQSVSGMFVHPEYDPDTVDNDIALLKLKRPLTINRFVSPICLPSPDDLLAANSLGTILGWGKRKNSAMFGSDVLHQAQVPIADVEDCKNVYKDKYMISENMVCAGYKKGKIDSCAGDSGGPLLFSKKQTPFDQKWYLYGITSFGEGCGKKNKYGIYAKVPNVVQWIRKTINENID